MLERKCDSCGKIILDGDLAVRNGVGTFDSDAGENYHEKYFDNVTVTIGRNKDAHMRCFLTDLYNKLNDFMKDIPMIK